MSIVFGSSLVPDNKHLGNAIIQLLELDTFWDITTKNHALFTFATQKAKFDQIY